MRITFRRIAMSLIWMLTVWVAFWGGFYKSLTISAYSENLGSKVQLADDTRLLRRIENGDAPGVKDALAARVALGSSLLKIHRIDKGSSGEWVMNIIFPSEAMTLISNYNHRLYREDP